MIKINSWEDEEVKTLFKFIEIKKSEGVPLIKIFKEFGERVGRCQNSVRNYYYNEIRNLTEDRNRCQNLQINLGEHVTQNAEGFTTEETKNVIQKINQMVKDGYSVRKACLTLSCGDIGKMIRYQNKYRSEMKKGNGETIEFRKNITQAQNVDVGLTLKQNIIKMPVKRNFMTDQDINALFMGLVKLVKKQETEKAKLGLESELELANLKLKNAMAEIIVKTAKIEKLQSEISLLENRVKNKNENEIQKRVKLVENGVAKGLLKEFVSKRHENRIIINRCI